MSKRPCTGDTPLAALLATLPFRLRLGRLCPWPGHRGVRLDAGDQRDRFISAERDVDVGCGLCHGSSMNPSEA